MFKLGEIEIPKDINSIKKKLDDENIPYEIDENGIVKLSKEYISNPIEMLFLIIALKKKLELKEK